MNNCCRPRAFARPGWMHQAGARRAGFTLVEILIGLTILGVIAAIAVPSYNGYIEKTRIVVAKEDILGMSTLISHYYNDHRAYPASLADVGMVGRLDPWKNPYKYLDLSDISNRGQARKDRRLVPINSDYDLYSMGKDGLSQAPLTAPASQDDVIRANNGRFVGLGSEY